MRPTHPDMVKHLEDVAANVVERITQLTDRHSARLTVSSQIDKDDVELLPEVPHLLEPDRRTTSGTMDEDHPVGGWPDLVCLVM
jgi:hypothetical protein